MGQLGHEQRLNGFACKLKCDTGMWRQIEGSSNTVSPRILSSSCIQPIQPLSLTAPCIASLVACHSHKLTHSLTHSLTHIYIYPLTYHRRHRHGAETHRNRALPGPLSVHDGRAHPPQPERPALRASHESTGRFREQLEAK